MGVREDDQVKMASNNKNNSKSSNSCQLNQPRGYTIVSICNAIVCFSITIVVSHMDAIVLHYSAYTAGGTTATSVYMYSVRHYSAFFR